MQLNERWRTINATDRLLAVQRLVQTGALPADVAQQLEGKNERVRALLARARVEKKRQEQHPTSDLKHPVLQLQLELQSAENDRDETIDERDLRGALYFCGETFVRDTAFAADELPLKELAERIKELQDHLNDLLRRADRKGARFTSTADDGVERTLIRMLPALTLSGESS